MGRGSKRIAAFVMTAHPAPLCEVKVDAVWRTFSLNEAQLHFRDAIKRCPACHGRVTILGTYGLQPRLALSHRRSHDGCPSNTRHYRGVQSRHPQPVD
ncbi:hypothetical protein SAMN02799622_01210 [Methylobacterium sp. UNC378MF]|jgi:hypothetical protein|nr:hypothetical protein SAMN02799622_01210 [Methylobacterium sp. UNC378MF]